MEPTLLIGDALVASKFPYGYGTASLPIQITLPETGRVFGDTPKRGDVVVFRWPGDRSQAWVKRVVGLPGDRIQMRQGQLFINDHAAALKPDGIGEVRRRQWRQRARQSLCRDAAERRQPRDFQDARQRPARQHARSHRAAGKPVRDGRQPRQFRRQPRLGARRRRRAVADRQSDRPRRRGGRLLGSWACAASRSGPGCPVFVSRGFSPRCIDRGARL